jgi:O-antigen ligase
MAKGSPLATQTSKRRICAPYWDRSMGGRLTTVRIVETVAAMVIIVMMSNALIGPVLDPLQTGGDTNPILRLMWLPVYGLIGLLAALRFPQLMRFWLPAAMVLVLLAWVFASVQWSIFPQITERRAIAVTATTLFGLYLAASYGGRAMAEIVAGTFLFLALGSYLVCIAVPSIGVHQDVNAGLWRGLWYEKNHMGAMMVYGSLAAIAAAITSPGRRPLWIVTLALCMGLIVMTRSATSALALAIVLVGAVTLAFMGRGPIATVAALWAAATGAMFLGGLFVFAPDLLYAAIGKDPSLTGRTEIWEAVLRASEKSPLLGYGFSAFWDINSTPAMWIRDQLGWVVPTAHNGWLDLLIQLGQIGVVLFATVLGVALVAAIFRYRKVEDGYFAILFLAVYTLTIMSESFILAHNSLPWVLAVAAMARVLGPAPALQEAPEPQREAAPQLVPAWTPVADWEPEPLAPTFGRRRGFAGA